MLHLLNPKALRYVTAVASTGSVQAAAREVAISASAIDRQILMLEEELGVQLFIRTPRGMDLTPAGELRVAVREAMKRGLLLDIGHGGAGFAFDNESPRHAVLLRPYALASRLVTHGEWLAFMDDGGYADPRWWMAAGWDWVRSQRITAPLYWQRDGEPARHGGWTSFTLHGRVPIDPHTPVVHISWFEADAYALWRGAQDGQPLRLPTEAEWEHAAHSLGSALQAQGNFLESGALHPMPLARNGAGLQQMGGDVWEWTASAYLPYPGYRPWAGAVGEYNGKFMVNQMVLRGGSCATPRDHIRPSYRNFFPTDARWQFSGLRLARDC